MAVLLSLAAIVFALTDDWYLAPFLAICAIACAADTLQRRRTDSPVSQLRRRQLDQLDDQFSDSPNPHG